MSAERPLSSRERRRVGRQIDNRLQEIRANTALREVRDGFDPDDVTKPRLVLTEVIPQPDFDAKWKSHVKTAAVIGGVGAVVAAVGSQVYKDDEGHFDAVKAGKALGKVAIVGGAEGISGVAGITIRHHRELTHKSLELTSFLQKYIDMEQRSLGVAEPYTWASVHRIHHAVEDAALYPHYRLHHAMQEAERRGLHVPEMYKNLDPFVKEFDRATVAKIGAAADAMMQERLADPRLGNKQYKKPTFEGVSNDDLLRILNPDEPQYTYPDYVKKTRPEEYTQDDIARILLTDPHSPALMSVQGIAINGVNLYQAAANMFRAIPLLKPEDLRQPDDELTSEKRKRKTRKAIVGGFAVNIGAQFVANHDFTGRGVARAVFEGTAVNGIRGAVEILGGNITNSAGHMGDPVQTELVQAFLNRKYIIKLKPDGTISTNTVGKGIAGRLASWATLDEVGGQEFHHAFPGAIKYTSKEGVDAWVEAPWGSLLEMLAKDERVKFIKEGKGFDGSREDVVTEAVQWVQQERAKQYSRDHAGREELVFSA